MFSPPPFKKKKRERKEKKKKKETYEMFLVLYFESLMRNKIPFDREHTHVGP